jgi:nitrate/nitrite-specific signal transduction histidine kinase
MQERSRLLNSNLQVSSKPGKGTTISVEFKE